MNHVLIFFFFKCNTVKISCGFVQGKVIEFGSSHLNQSHLQSLLGGARISEYPVANCLSWIVKFCISLTGIRSLVFTTVFQNSFLRLSALMNLPEKLL